MTDIIIRPLADLEERRECLRLQEATWGEGFADRVAPSILMIAQKTGGVASGAFHDGRLIGFVFGISGVRDGRLIHWSDMLAVLPEYRDRNIGMRLKLHQRDLLLDRGVEMVLWTFDPLVARNAYLNLRRLGAVVRTYERDLYGRSHSPLHAGIGTDRLVAEWGLASERVKDRLATAGGGDQPAAAEGLLLNPPTSGDETAQGSAHPRPGTRLHEPEGDTVQIMIPADIQPLLRGEPALARAWRENVRGAFERALSAGYTAVDVIRGDRLARYVLARNVPD